MYRGISLRADHAAKRSSSSILAYEYGGRVRHGTSEGRYHGRSLATLRPRCVLDAVSGPKWLASEKIRAHQRTSDLALMVTRGYRETGTGGGTMASEDR